MLFLDVFAPQSELIEHRFEQTRPDLLLAILQRRETLAIIEAAVTAGYDAFPSAAEPPAPLAFQWLTRASITQFGRREIFFADRIA
jgi:hypothetical protein